MDKIRVGIVGAGMIGQLAHLKNFAELDGCEVVAIAELRPELGRQAARRFGVPTVHSDHHALLDDDVDAVVVVTRRHATGPIVLDALNAGKHVLSEKPMAHSTEQAGRLVEAAEQKGVVYSVGYMKRHDIGVQHAKAVVDELLETQTFGRPLFLRGYCFGGDIGVASDGFSMTDEPRPDGIELWPMAPDWLAADLIDEYAWFLNVEIHIINLLRHFARRTPDVTGVDFTHANGRTVDLDFGDFAGTLEFGETEGPGWHEGIEMIFEKGRIAVEMPPPLDAASIARVSISGPGANSAPAPEPTPGQWAFRRQALAFIDDIRQGAASITAGADAIDDLAVAERIWRRRAA
jgi:predicted dehydrogenase